MYLKYMQFLHFSLQKARFKKTQIKIIRIKFSKKIAKNNIDENNKKSMQKQYKSSKHRQKLPEDVLNTAISKQNVVFFYK